MYEAIPAFYKAAENVLNEHLDASIVATTNAAAKAAPQANSTLLSYDSSSYVEAGGPTILIVVEHMARAAMHVVPGSRSLLPRLTTLPTIRTNTLA